MEPNDNKQLALQKAINSHEQAAAALADLMAGSRDARYDTMVARIEANIADLQAASAASKPEDHL